MAIHLLVCRLQCFPREFSELPALNKELQIEIEECREMNDAEAEIVASLLFGWWKKEFEAETDRRVHNHTSGYSDTVVSPSGNFRP